MTNREKFEEVFNYHPDLDFCPIYCTYKDTECTNFTKDREQNDTCETGEWWELEYQEPKQSNKSFQWCTDCQEYDHEKHCCPRYSKVIRRTVEEMKQEQESVLNKIRAEITTCLKALDEIEKSGLNIFLPNEISGRRLTYQQCLEFIDKYKADKEHEDGNVD